MNFALSVAGRKINFTKKLCIYLKLRKRDFS